MREVKTLEELCDGFDKEAVDMLFTKSRLPSTVGFVLFENEQMDSSHLGERSILHIAVGNTYQTIEECEGKWLNDLPSQRQYPITFWRKSVIDRRVDALFTSDGK